MQQSHTIDRIRNHRAKSDTVVQHWTLSRKVRHCQAWSSSNLFDAVSLQAISGENFSQSEYVAVGAFFQFAFLTLTRSDPSCVPLCKSFEHVWQTSVSFHKSFERQFLYGHSISSNPHVLLAEAHSKYRFEAVSIAENSTDPYAFACID